MVSPAYFETLGVRITRGRAFTEADRTGAVLVAIVNETFVKRYFPDLDPLTQRIIIEQFNPATRTSGPASSGRSSASPATSATCGPASDLPEIDVPFAQSTWPAR